MKKLRTILFEKKKKKVRLFENKNWDKKQKALKEKKKNLPLLKRTLEMQEYRSWVLILPSRKPIFINLKVSKTEGKKKPWFSS